MTLELVSGGGSEAAANGIICSVERLCTKVPGQKGEVEEGETRACKGGKRKSRLKSF